MKKQKVITVSEALNLIKSGNRADGVELLYKHHYNKMYGVAFSIVKDEYKSKEVVSRICYRLMTIEGENLPQKSEMAWLYSVIKNQSLDLLKSEKPDLPLEDLVKVGTDDVNINDFVNMEAYYSMIKGLNEEQRLIVTLKVIGGFTHKEIAQMLQKPVATVQWVYNTSVKKLKVALSSLILSFVGLVTLLIYAIVDPQKFIKGYGSATPPASQGGLTPGGTTSDGYDYVPTKANDIKVIIICFLILLTLLFIVAIFTNSHNVATKAEKTKKGKRLVINTVLAVICSVTLISVGVFAVMQATKKDVYEFFEPGYVKVSVKDQNGEPITNMQIHVVDFIDQKWENTFETDEKGDFYFYREEYGGTIFVCILETPKHDLYTAILFIGDQNYGFLVFDMSK